MNSLTIRPVASKADRKAFVDFAWDVYREDPAWIPHVKTRGPRPSLTSEEPWFEHARAELFLAERNGRVVAGSARKVDDIVLEPMGLAPASGACSRRLMVKQRLNHQDSGGLASRTGHDPPRSARSACRSG